MQNMDDSLDDRCKRWTVNWTCIVNYGLESKIWTKGVCRIFHGKKPNVLGSNEQNLAKYRQNRRKLQRIFEFGLLAKLLRFSEI